MAGAAGMGSITALGNLAGDVEKCASQNLFVLTLSRFPLFRELFTYRTSWIQSGRSGALRRIARQDGRVAQRNAVHNRHYHVPRLMVGSYLVTAAVAVHFPAQFGSILDRPAR